VILGLIYNVNEYMEEVCCLISPFSVPHFSFPVIEAHMARKPVIASDVEGMDEIIDHGRNGLIVPINNPEALAKAINELTKNSAKAKQLGEEGYMRAIQKYTSKNIVQIEHLYDKLLVNED
jgi:glycosyltransferase involved in cell wall biosynthesis